nr:MAG: replication associated protein [Smacoviridae sp.]
MITAPRTVPKRVWKIMLDKWDVKKYVVGFETGKHGYLHYQIRLRVSGTGFDEWILRYVPIAHIERATDTDRGYDYERKEGRFISSEDRVDVRKQRFGEPRGWQKDAVKALRTQNDREVDVWYDPIGNRGKSWLCGHLFETGKAMVVPRDWTKASEITNYICLNYHGQDAIVIDIPKDAKIPAEFYKTIEILKDGLIGSVKWEGKMINIRGVAIAIFTNTKLDPDGLTKDRWRFHYITTMNSAEARGRFS